MFKRAILYYMYAIMVRAFKALKIMKSPFRWNFYAKLTIILIVIQLFFLFLFQSSLNYLYHLKSLSLIPWTVSAQANNVQYSTCISFNLHRYICNISRSSNENKYLHKNYNCPLFGEWVSLWYYMFAITIFPRIVWFSNDWKDSHRRHMHAIIFFH